MHPSSLFILLILCCCCSIFTINVVNACGGHHHHHHDHDPEGSCPFSSKENQQQQQQKPITSELVRTFHQPSTKKKKSTNTDEDFELVNLVSVRFSRFTDEETLTTNPEWTCNPEIVGVEATKSRKAPHGYYSVPVSSQSTKSKAGKSNRNSITLLNEHSAEEMIKDGLATDASSTSQHSDIPVHAIAFDHPDFPKSSLVHLFRDPRFERLHDGHYPTKEQDRHTMKTKKTSKREHPHGGSSDLPQDHPAHECTKKGECHVDRVHQRYTAIEMFWIPQSVKEVVFSCSFPNSEQEEQYKKVKIQQQQNQNDKSSEKIEAPPSTTLRPQFYSSLPLHVEPHIARREAELLAAAGQPEVIRLREVGPPETTYSVVFLSGGYRTADRQMFIDNVTAIADMLMDPQMDLQLPQDTADSIANIHRSCPFNRYFGFWNAYAVYQPSNDAGASRPLIGQVVDNNLGCYHPAEIERAVSCDRAIAAALVKVSPAPFASDPERVVIICVVNTAIYGGSAIYIPGKMHFANFFNGFELDKQGDKERMLSLVDHEIGHALGNLMDEYSVGVDEPSGRYLRNCQVRSGGGPPSPVQWNSWITLKQSAGAAFRSTYGNDLLGSPNWDVLSTPEAVCGFTNYYKPNSNCMMHRLNDFFMCPVCREQATLQVFTRTFVYEFPRLPYKDQILLVSNDNSVVPEDQVSVNTSSTVVVHLNRLLTTVNGFTVAAFDTDNTPLTVIQTFSCPACIELGPSNFAKYSVDTEVRIRVTISDNTRNFVLAENRASHSNQLNQETFFRIVVTSTHPSNISGAALYNYSTKAEFSAELGQVGFNESDLIPRYIYCLNNNVTWQNRNSETEIQKNASFCSSNLSRAAAPYEEPEPLAAVQAELDTWVPIALAAMAILFIMLWLWASQKYTDMSNGKVRPIFKTELSGLLTLVRGVMTASAVIFLIASIVAIGGAAYVYYNTSLLGKVFVLFGIVIAVILYLMAFFGFWAVSSRSKRMLLVNGFVLLIPLGIGIWLLITLNAFGSELDGAANWNPSLNATNSDGVTAKEQIGEWMKKLEELWLWMVEEQPSWACSFQGVLECSGYYTSCSGTLGSTATCPTGCPDLNERFSSPCQKRLQDYIVEHYSYAVTAIALGTALLGAGFLLNTLNFLLLWSEKSKIQNRNQNTIKREAARLGNPALAQKKHDMYSMMLLKTLDKSDRSALVREFKRIDRDGNGELTRGELAYFINGALKHKPSKAEIDKIFSVADLDNNGTISLREFLMIFGWESGEIDSVSRPKFKTGPLQKMTSFARRTGKEVPPGYHAGPPGSAAPPSSLPPPRAKQLSAEQMAMMRSQMRQRAKDVYGDQFLTATPQTNPMAAMQHQHQHNGGEMNQIRAAPASSPSPPPQHQHQTPVHHQQQAQQYHHQQRQQAGSVTQQPIPQHGGGGYQGRPPIHDDNFEL